MVSIPEEVPPTLAAGLLLLVMNTPEELLPVLGAMTAALLFLFPFWKTGGLGAGDIKLLMALAPLMGPRWFLFGTVLSFLIGAGISAISAGHVTDRPAGFILARFLRARHRNSGPPRTI